MLARTQDRSSDMSESETVSSKDIQNADMDMTEPETVSSTAIQNADINGDFELSGTANGLNQRVTEDGLNESEIARSTDDQEGNDGSNQRITEDGLNESKIAIRINDQEGEPNQEGWPSNQKYVNVERIFLITNFVMELPSAIFDQLSSVHKPQYALISMIISFAVMFICIIDLARTGRREKVKLMMRGHIPWFYSPSRSYKPLGTFVDIVGLVCGIFQCVFAAIAYAFLSHKAQSPIKICVWPLIFASGVLWSRFPRNASVVEPSDVHPDSPPPPRHALKFRYSKWIRKFSNRFFRGVKVKNDEEKVADLIAKVTTVYKVDMHCDGCGRQIRRAVKRFEGVDAVHTDFEGKKLVVTGKVDPMKIKAKLEKVSKTKVDILS